MGTPTIPQTHQIHLHLSTQPLCFQGENAPRNLQLPRFGFGSPSQQLTIKDSPKKRADLLRNKHAVRAGTFRMAEPASRIFDGVFVAPECFRLGPIHCTTNVASATQTQRLLLAPLHPFLGAGIIC